LFLISHHVFLQEFEGGLGDAQAGREYFKQQFLQLARGAGRSEKQNLYMQYVVSEPSRNTPV
jgi:hypothetical protein